MLPSLRSIETKLVRWTAGVLEEGQEVGCEGTVVREGPATDDEGPAVDNGPAADEKGPALAV